MLKRVCFVYSFFIITRARIASNTAKEKRKISLSTQQTPQRMYKSFSSLTNGNRATQYREELSLSFILFYGD